jgi:hypothetical protein
MYTPPSTFATRRATRALPRSYIEQSSTGTSSLEIFTAEPEAWALAPGPFHLEEPAMRTDFDNLNDGDRITIYPAQDNPLHKEPVKATYQAGYFYCDGTNPTEGPDYYLADVLKWNEGFEKE